MISTIKKYLWIILVIVLGLLMVSTCVLYNRSRNLANELSISLANEKPFLQKILS